MASWWLSLRKRKPRKNSTTILPPPPSPALSPSPSYEHPPFVTQELTDNDSDSASGLSRASSFDSSTNQSFASMPPPRVPPPPPSPTAAEEINRMEYTIVDTSALHRPERSQVVYDSKTAEWEQFCQYVYKTSPFVYNLSADKIFRFMFYQAYRNKKKRGGNKEKRTTMSRFDSAQYEEVMSQHEEYWRTGDIDKIPFPTNPVGKQAFDQYKAVLRKIYKE